MNPFVVMCIIPSLAFAEYIYIVIKTNYQERTQLMKQVAQLKLQRKMMLLQVRNMFFPRTVSWKVQIFLNHVAAAMKTCPQFAQQAQSYLPEIIYEAVLDQLELLNSVQLAISPYTSSESVTSETSFEESSCSDTLDESESKE